MDNISKLGEIASIKTGKIDSNAARENGKYPFFTCDQETLRTDTYSFDTKAVLLAGNNARGIFPIKYYEGKFDVYQRTYVIESLHEDELLTRYLYYALSLELEYFRNVSTGVTTKFLTLSILNDLRVKVPLITTQKKIVDTLSGFDDLIEVDLSRIRILEEIAQSVYNEWFVQLKYPGHKDVEIMQTSHGPKPERWEIEKLSDLVDTQYGYTESANDESVGPKFLRGMDINKRSYIDWSEVPYCPIDENNHKKFSLKKGDILVIRMADPGKAGMVEDEIDAVFASYLVRLKIKSDRISPYYLYYFLLSDKYQGYISGASTGTTRKSASASVLTGIYILIPPRETLERFERIVSELRNLLNRLVEENSTLRQMRDLILPKLISGEVDLSEFDANVSGD